MGARYALSPLAPYLKVLLSADCSLPQKNSQKEGTNMAVQSSSTNDSSIQHTVLEYLYAYVVLFWSLFPSSKSVQMQKRLFIPSYKSSDKINLSSSFKQWSFFITYIYLQAGRCTYSRRRNWTCQSPFLQRKSVGILRDSLMASSVVTETKRTFEIEFFS